MDGEAGITANSSKQYFLEKGINLHIRAKTCMPDISNDEASCFGTSSTRSTRK